MESTMTRPGRRQQLTRNQPGSAQRQKLQTGSNNGRSTCDTGNCNNSLINIVPKTSRQFASETQFANIIGIGQSIFTAP